MTLLELLVVLMIISLLSTIAVGVFNREVERARIARARAEIRALEVAIERYQIDTGQYPVSSSGSELAPASPNPIGPVLGCGYLQLCLHGSLSGNPHIPLSPLWNGPYMEWDDDKLGPLPGLPLTAAANLQYLDPWGHPYFYIANYDYGVLGGTELPPSDFYYPTETYYNVSTFQLFSLGPDGSSSNVPSEYGTEADDINNWEGPGV